jgi:1-phosphofructokinase
MQANIITVTLNPAIDQAVTLDHLRPGQVHRATSVARNAGGKGVNVSSCLADFSLASTATGFLGAANQASFTALFAAKRITDAFIRVQGETRTNIKLLHDGDTTDINLPGPPADPDALADLIEFLAGAAAKDTILLLAGSLPAGLGAKTYANLIATLKPAGAKIFLDTSAAPLTAALNADVLPHCIKPNRAELEEFCGRSLPTHADLVTAAQTLRAKKIETVVISLGAEGAIFVGAKVLHASLPAIRAENTVGAGDAMVAGLIAAAAAHLDPEATARLATAFAAAKLGQPGPNLPEPDIISQLAKQVKITELEGAKP